MEGQEKKRGGGGGGVFCPAGDEKAFLGLIKKKGKGKEWKGGHFISCPHLFGGRKEEKVNL